MAGKLWVPETAREHIGVCNICGYEAPYRDAQAHMVRCARQYMDAIRAASPSQKWKGEAFDPETWDPEVEEHLKRVGQRMLREGRMTVKPNERAGL